MSTSCYYFLHYSFVQPSYTRKNTVENNNLQMYTCDNEFCCSLIKISIIAWFSVSHCFGSAAILSYFSQFVRISQRELQKLRKSACGIVECFVLNNHEVCSTCNSRHCIVRKLFTLDKNNEFHYFLIQFIVVLLLLYNYCYIRRKYCKTCRIKVRK